MVSAADAATAAARLQKQAGPSGDASSGSSGAGAGAEASAAVLSWAGRVSPTAPTPACSPASTGVGSDASRRPVCFQVSSASSTTSQQPAAAAAAGGPQAPHPLHPHAESYGAHRRLAAEKQPTPHWQAAWAAQQPARHVVTTFACGPAADVMAAMPPAEAVAHALRQLDEMFGALLGGCSQQSLFLHLQTKHYIVEQHVIARAPQVSGSSVALLAGTAISVREL